MGPSSERLKPTEARPADAGREPLGLWDAVSLGVGIVVGVGIFRTAGFVFAQAGGPGVALAVWGLGGLLSLAGALCFAELASTFPRSGGEYVYLTQAYGRWAGFLFAWAQLAVIRSGGAIASVAYVFAGYAAVAVGLPRAANAALAAAVIVLLTALNVLGVHLGRRAQNLLTALKVLAIAGVIAAGFLATPPVGDAAAATPLTLGSFSQAMVFVLYAYSGWHEAAYVTAEVRDRRRNVPRALIAGAAIVTVLYVLINAAYLAGLGYAKARDSKEIAAEVLAGALGPRGGQLMAALVMLSALGSLNGSIFTGARIYREMGAEHRLFAPLTVLSPRLGTPVRALVLQGVFGVGMVLVVGWALPRWLPPTTADPTKAVDPFEALVNGTAPVFWLCFLLAGVSLFVFRARSGGVRPPFAVPGYPVVPLLFCGWCAAMLAGSIAFAWKEAVAGLVVLGLGVPLALLSRTLERKKAA